MNPPSDVMENASNPVDGGIDLPPGDHPLEVAARRGIGPLSKLGQAVWHGDSAPCVSCGQLVRRGHVECPDCGQDLTPDMIEKMRAHAGPWYVLEHVRPFPGVSLDRLIRQIRRGVLTATSIVRGPSTDYQWRFAIETPGLCRFFGRCWSCHDPIKPDDAHCQSCLAYLGFEPPRKPVEIPQYPALHGEAGLKVGSQGNRGSAPAPGSNADGHDGENRDAGRHLASRIGRVPPVVTPRGDSIRVLPAGLGTSVLEAALVEPDELDGTADIPLTEELKELSRAVQTARPHRDELVAAPRILGIRATWVVVVMLLAVIGGLLLVTQSRLPNAVNIPTQQTSP